MKPNENMEWSYSITTANDIYHAKNLLVDQKIYHLITISIQKVDQKGLINKTCTTALVS
jgi:hypothetical protein